MIFIMEFHSFFSGPGQKAAGASGKVDFFPKFHWFFYEGRAGNTRRQRALALSGRSRYNAGMSATASSLSRQQAWDLFRQYNKDPFHLQHALTVEGVMKWFSGDQGFGGEAEFWGNVGLLHDIDFERFPGEHCMKAPELLRAGGADEALIHAVCSHGYGLTAVDAKPEHRMEKILYAADELTGLVWAAAIIRPSKSVQDMEVKSVKKKFKTPAFAAGCSRQVIESGAAMLGWELDALIEKTILAMRSCESEVNAAVAALK
jgi:predicted hydrolase (HD superfamily)